MFFEKETALTGGRVELLAPAGSREAFCGAVSAGADAVYLGGERFGARAYAENFSTDDILQAVREAHILGRKVYLTANVLTREEELPELTAFVRQLYEGGLDGVIVQDLGVLSALQKACPGLPLHASTQMSVTGAEAVRYLRRFGVSRVVPARELSLEEIRLLRREEPGMEIEAFIHGAMCYSYSGRCLMSSFLGGRSGNRGRCAGTCRLPYRILDETGRPAGPDAGKKEVWPLSMKDMCVLQILPELIDAGIHSFKIEGRMKKPVYAAGVTAIYRKYIDRYYAWSEAGRPEPWTIEESDLEKLKSLYIRTELGTGYYHVRNGRELITIGKPGYAGTDAGLEEKIRQRFLQGLPRRGISGRAVFRIGEPARLEIFPAGSGSGEENPFAAGPDQRTAEAQGAVVQRALGRPLETGELRTRLQKTGDSLFTFRSLEIEADENIFLPVSAVNALRREALQKLQECLLTRRQDASGTGCGGASSVHSAGHCGTAEAAESDRTGEPVPGSVREKESSGRRQQQEVWAIVSSVEQKRAAVLAGCTCIIIDGEFLPSSEPDHTRISGPDETRISEPDKTRIAEPDKNRIPWPDENSFFGTGGPDPDVKKPDFSQKTQKRNKSDVQSAGIKWICALPPVFRGSSADRIRQKILSAGANGFSGILVRTLEELQLAKECGYSGELIADSSLYSWNSLSMSALLADCSRIVCSPELHRKDILAAASDAQGTDALVLPVYGRIPMMETAGCVRKTENACSRAEGFWALEDRMGKHLPVRCRCADCSNTIYNAVPLSLHQFAGQGLFARVPVLLCMFTTEDGEETGRILTWFRRLAGSSAGRTGRSKRGKGKKSSARGGSSRIGKEGTGEQPPFTEFTNGHYRSGVL